jgi:hypothetical protein
MPDVHIGRGATVGTVIPTRAAIVPAAVGVDIGCGMLAVKTDLNASDLPESLSRLRAQIERAGERRLLAFQISDWLLASRDALADRGMMGDGVIDLPLVRSWMEEAGYRGFHEVEILSSGNWWRRDPDEVLATCRMRHQTAS